MNHYYSLSTYFKRHFNHRVQKIPLDAGFTCPNRDGTLSTKGCVFCNPKGSGSGLAKQGLTLAEQWTVWKERYEKKFSAPSFLAYLQSFSNTHGPASRLKQVLDEIRPLPGIVGIAIGTRPDCLDPDKFALLASLLQPDAHGHRLAEVWLELGLQSSNDTTLTRINRGHTFDQFAQACTTAHSLGLKICAHVIAGLPGESTSEFLQTIQDLAHLPIAAIKFHNLYVAKDTMLEQTWKQGAYTPLSRDAYLKAIVKALELLPPHVVIQRLTGDAAEGELLAPQWASDKSTIIRDIQNMLRATDTWQGKQCPADTSAHTELPPHFTPPARNQK